MSAGNFINTRYDADYDVAIHPIRVQPETITAEIGTIVNAPPTAPATSPISAQVSRSTRSLGLHARVVFAKIAGTPPTGYAAGSTIRLPVLNSTFYNAALKGVLIQHLGTTWTITGRRGEVTR